MAKRHTLWALLGILIFLFFNFPLLQIFNRDILWAGIPILLIYLYVVWVLAIVGLYTLGRRSIFRE
ncbi:hypothetical protein Desac_0757 [Desulfobacca acetoxidans DSM 11109]|uniref:DUF3311 domain-containing protein n=1 Tax=Desulfobacca acetoxidans (strain ATCC 700848 / DSM 11109 / ASRB2) TaxID=880072 RepID=F2NF81_DESAR|nr:hypothetical protein Desac_0757 [Desulfobacca acetoxidans DSM 11109]